MFSSCKMLQKVSSKFQNYNRIRYYSVVPKVQIDSFPLEEISKFTKIKTARLESALKKNDSLYRSHLQQWTRCFKTLVEQGLKTETCLNMVTECPHLLQKTESELITGIENWRNCQFGESSIQHLLATHPYFITLPAQRINQITGDLLSFVSSRQKVKQIIELNPKIMYSKWSDVQNVIDYIINIMKIETSEIYKSSSLQMPLEELKCRHIFLVRLGMYKPRNPKASPLDPCTNPKLHQITDTDDVKFATKVCTVTLEEFRVFQQLFEREEYFGEDSEQFDENDVDEKSH